MFTSIKMEDNMEFELSGIFRVYVETRNIVLRSLGKFFMHMMVNSHNDLRCSYDMTHI